LLLLLVVMTVIMQPPKEKKEITPQYFVPAYTYTGSIKPVVSHNSQQRTQKIETRQENSPKINKKYTENTESHEPDKYVKEPQGTLRIGKIKSTNPPVKKEYTKPKSILLDSLNMLKQEQLQELSKARDSEPIYLIGDDNAPADPLIKLM